MWALAVWCAGCAGATGARRDGYGDAPWLACKNGEHGVVTSPIPVSPPAERVTAGQMTEEAAQAKRLFDSERWVEARAALDRIVRGGTQDDTGNRQIAEYYLGIAAYRLNDYRAALAAFSIITSDPSHLKYAETLLWLAKLAELEPTSTDAIDLLVRYDEPMVARFQNPQQLDLYGLLHFAMGRAWYRRGDVARARQALERVPHETPARRLAEACLPLSR